jgi:hypothetical protein
MSIIKLKTCSIIRSLSLLMIIAGLIIPVQMVSAQKKKGRKAEAQNIAAQLPEIVLTRNGISPYRIVIPSSPSAQEQKAATVLQDYLMQISGTALPVISASWPGSSYEIILGQNERLDALGIAVNFNELGADGFVIKTDSLRLIIAGGNDKGTLFGVYTFLEKYLGCRMYTPEAKIIPVKDTILLGKIEDTEIPEIKYRTIHYKASWDEEFVDWHKLNHDAEGERPAWGTWVHTFNHLVPPEIYFKDHPEYFALRDGKRLPTQLCLSNPDVVKVVIQNLRRQIARHPEARYWSVSQNDNRQYCMCDECRALDEKEGAHSGTMLNFVNQVAAEFPDYMISTLAYEYTRKAPATIKPLKNVNIMLCSIEVRRDRPIETADDSMCVSFVKDVSDWGRIAGDIIVWDYVIQFNNLVSPFPNLQVLQPNLQFFTKNGVTAMFEQGNREVGGEFAELRTYLISKLLWDPYANSDTIINDFLKGYYGEAGKHIRQYIDEMREALISSDQPLKIFGSPVEAEVSYLRPELIARYKQIFDEAEMSVASDPKILERVRIARQPLNFAIMEQSKKNFTGQMGVFIKDGDRWVVRPEIRSMIDPFTDLCLRQGVTRLREWSTTPEAYRSDMYRMFYQGRNEHLAYNKKVSLISPEPSAISEEDVLKLTDGIRASNDSRNNWVDFQGKDLDAIIDLGKVQKVQHIECAFYQLAAWLSIVPKKVEFYVSEDGKTFRAVGTVDNTLPIDQYDSFQKDFIADFKPEDARYVRVVARTIGNTPESHPGAGQAAWMHIDEIVVE